jgi:hypothetical protein
MKIRVELSHKEYLEKKLEAAKEIIPVLMSQQSNEYMRDVRKRASVIYNSVAIAGEMLSEVGLYPEGKITSVDHESTAIRKLSDIMDSNED